MRVRASLTYVKHHSPQRHPRGASLFLSLKEGEKAAVFVGKDGCREKIRAIAEGFG